MDLAELKKKSPAELLAYAEELQIENIGSLRKQDMMFSILKTLAENDVAIFGSGVLIGLILWLALWKGGQDKVRDEVAEAFKREMGAQAA